MPRRMDSGPTWLAGPLNGVGTDVRPSSWISNFDLDQRRAGVSAMGSFELSPGRSSMTKLKPRAFFLVLLLIQLTGTLFIILEGLPEFRHLVAHPGEQLHYTRYDNPATPVMIIAMQVAYWYRLWRVPIPFQGSNTILSHLFLFLGRLAFIFGGSLFGVVFFRHLPEIDYDADLWLMWRRGLQLAASLFALFCATLELERLGRALASKQQD